MEYDDITSINVNENGTGQLYVSKMAVDKLGLKNKDHLKVFVNKDKITFEKVE
jgi:hypothetical protein